MAILLGCDALTLDFPTKQVFHDVTLGVDEGDRIGIVGKNGDGKSTLLALLAGALEPDEGRVTHRRDLAVGLLGQRDALDDAQTVHTAGVGDTLRFSHVGYVPVEMVVADSLEREDYLLGVFMSRDTVMLSEVLVVPRFLEREVRLNPFLQNAYQNLNRALRAASRPVEKMDSEMNQRMQIEEFARRVEMKGMVDVRFGVGLYSFQALKALKASRERGRGGLATPRELDLLKRVFNAEKKGK